MHAVGLKRRAGSDEMSLLSPFQHVVAFGYSLHLMIFPWPLVSSYTPRSSPIASSEGIFLSCMAILLFGRWHALWENCELTKCPGLLAVRAAVSRAPWLVHGTRTSTHQKFTAMSGISFVVVPLVTQFVCRPGYRPPDIQSAHSP